MLFVRIIVINKVAFGAQIIIDLEKLNTPRFPCLKLRSHITGNGSEWGTYDYLNKERRLAVVHAINGAIFVYTQSSLIGSNSHRKSR